MARAYRLKQSKQRQRRTQSDRRSACHGARYGEGPVLAMLPQIKSGCAWLCSSHPLRCARGPENDRSGRESRLTSIEQESQFARSMLGRTAMHFYSGPSMHLLSGVDTSPRAARVISGTLFGRRHYGGHARRRAGRTLPPFGSALPSVFFPYAWMMTGCFAVCGQPDRFADHDLFVDRVPPLFAHAQASPTPRNLRAPIQITPAANG